MEIKPYENQYKHQVVDCPFCEHNTYVRDVSKLQPDALRDLKRHITNQAKNEAFAKAIDIDMGNEIKTAHLDYYVAHTKIKAMPTKAPASKREYDADLTLK